MFLNSTLIQTFEPLRSPFDMTFGIALGLCLILIIEAIYLFKKEVSYTNRNRKNVLLMLSLFGGMIALGVVLFTTVNSFRIKPISVYTDKVILPSESISYQKLKRAYIHIDKQGSHLNPQITVDTALLLVMEKMDGQSFVFSEDYYDIKSIVVAINEVME